MSQSFWIFAAAAGWLVAAVQGAWIERLQHRLREGHMREGEYCSMLDRLHNDRSLTKGQDQ